MYIYLYNYIVLLLCGMLLLNHGKKDNKYKFLFCTIATMQWVVLSGLRNISVGADTKQYYDGHFYLDLFKGWSDIVPNLIGWLKGREVEEPGYFALQIFFQTFSDNYQMYLVFIAALFTIPLGYWIYKHSTDPMISFVIYFSLFSPFFAITGIAQTVATVVVVFGGYKYLVNRQFIPFVIVCLFGATFHRSALFYLAIYFVAWIPIGKMYYVAAFSVFAGLMAFKELFIKVVISLTGYTNFAEQYSSGTYNFTIMYVAICALVAWRSKKIIDKSKEIQVWVNAVFLGLMLVPLTFINSTAMRGVQYFSVFLMLLIPKAIDTFEYKDKQLVRWVMSFALGIMFFKNMPQYKFFWQ